MSKSLLTRRAIKLGSSITTTTGYSSEDTSNSDSQGDTFDYLSQLQCENCNKMSSMVIRNVSPSRNCSYETSWNKIAKILSEVVLRIVLFVLFIKIERMEPFERVIQPEEWWMYKYPPTADYVPPIWILSMTFILPLFVVSINFCITKNKLDFSASNNVITLAIALNGLTTSLIKVTVGRPRPDFFHRCYSNGTIPQDNQCDGDVHEIREGRKSFPSGHSSFAFTAFGFLFFYISAKLHVFSERGRGQTWRFCLALLPLFIALLIAISRTCDYHHHWQDALVGSFVGISIVYLCYRQYYPSICSKNAHLPYIVKRKITTVSSKVRTSITSESPIKFQQSPVAELEEKKLLIDNEEDNKWI